ncbi:hypothetical protein PILCRDRAFT_82797, partial [Piloderma croceum F 1598]
CPSAESGHKDFAVIDTNSIHHVNVNFCRCHHIAHRCQLLRIGWWPATLLQPQMCATMEVLKHFHLLNLQGKVPAYSFYHALEFQTNNTGLLEDDRMASFMLMTRQWQHIKMVKWAGHVFDPGGISAMVPGSLAIPCHACPLPNINLPPGWQHVLPAQAYVIFQYSSNFLYLT